MLVISCLANLRARNYEIQEVDELKAKLLAGRIIPAVATSTAVATGFICLELYKIIQKKKLDSFRNSFVNLAIPMFTLAEPVAVKKTIFRNMEWTLWDRWTIVGDITLKKFFEWLENKHLEAYSLSVGDALL